MSKIKTSCSDNAPEDIARGRSVLKTEIEGLQRLMESIDTPFAQAIEIIHSMKNAEKRGRLIVAGIGKSGHICRKIAASLASTGTPAYFVHPGEASHGDMGMITEHDVVLMLSNSGENSELSDLIHYTRRYEIPLISITSNAGSALAQHSDVCLLLPKAPEACPNGLAPTTSTTMMLALGDALTVTLLERMGLTPEQYKVFHPGGKLGQRLLKVSELMVTYENLPLVKESALMDEALIVLTSKNLGAAIVIGAQGELKGIITDGDLKRHMGPGLLQMPVTKVMTLNPKTISANALGVEAVNSMTKISGQYLSSLIVTEKDRLVGMIRLQDCLKAGLA
jgi:arabinose-5-phosphate isomerase